MSYEPSFELREIKDRIAKEHFSCLNYNDFWEGAGRDEFDDMIDKIYQEISQVNEPK